MLGPSASPAIYKNPHDQSPSSHSPSSISWHPKPHPGVHPIPYPPIPFTSKHHPTTHHHHYQHDEEEIVENMEDVPEMDSPGKTSTSDLSCSMCLTPSIRSAGLPSGSATSSRPASLVFGAIATPLITPFGSPPSRPPSFGADPPAQAKLPDHFSHPGHLDTPNRLHASSHCTTPLKLDTSRPFPFPEAVSFESNSGKCPHTASTVPSSPPCTSPISLSERSKSLPNLPRCVTFCDQPPIVWRCLDGEEYDRSPHPVVIRLSYRDVLELREMKVELGIVTRRQTVVGGGVGGFAGRKLSDPSRGGEGGPPGLQFGAGGGRSSPMQEEEPNPPSPSALFSSFPSSTRLITGLQRIPDPQPPKAASGMGMSVEPSFGLDSYARTSPSLGGPAGSPGRRGRTISNSSLRDDGSSSVGGMGPKRIQRKTSGDLSMEELEKESEFKAELRAAREELERQEAKEAAVRASALGGRASSSDHRRENGSVEVMGVEGRRGGSANGLGSGSGKARTSSFFNTAPGATFNEGAGPSRTSMLVPPGRMARPTGPQLLLPLAVDAHDLHSPLPERSPIPGGVTNVVPDEKELKGGMLGRQPGSASADEVSALSQRPPGPIKLPSVTPKASMTFHANADENQVGQSGATAGGTTGITRPSSRRQGSYTSSNSMIRPPSPIAAPYTRSFPLSVSTVAANTVSTDIVGGAGTYRIQPPTPMKESRILEPPSPVLKPFTSSVKA